MNLKELGKTHKVAQFSAVKTDHNISVFKSLLSLMRNYIFDAWEDGKDIKVQVVFQETPETTNGIDITIEEG